MKRWLSGTILCVSVALCLALSACYLIRPEQCAAVTLWPAWFWFPLGLVLTSLGLKRINWRPGVAVLLLWVLFLGTCAEEPKALLTALRRWPDPEWERLRATGAAVRIISLNCAGGSEEAAAELIPYHPDIALLQEIPSRPELEALARRLFRGRGAVIAAWDTAVLCRGEASEALLPRETRAFAVSALIQPAKGVRFQAISTRLYPPLLRLDLWSPDCWRSARKNHMARARQAEALAQHLQSLPETVPVILGGDFNAPAGDRIFRLFAPRLRDAFPEADIGWGNTVTNETPVSRFDQVWVSPRIRVAAVISKRTRHSDHRIVICDLLVDR